VALAWSRRWASGPTCCPTRRPTTPCCGCWRCRGSSRCRPGGLRVGARDAPPPGRTATSWSARHAGLQRHRAAGANTKGALSIVSVVGSLYPVMTLILARAVLGERIRPCSRRASPRPGRRRHDRGRLASCHGGRAPAGSRNRGRDPVRAARHHLAPSRAVPAGGGRASWAACA
jgi:hypothetical protein